MSFCRTKYAKCMTKNAFCNYKQEDRLDPKNYRPISVVPILTKIMEKVVFKRLTAFLAANYHLFIRQYGFVSGSSTVCGLFDLISSIQASLDRKLKTAGVFLGNSKAFDSVNHEFLLRKLRCFGIRYEASRWFESQ
jgi:hypothetical protein